MNYICGTTGKICCLETPRGSGPSTLKDNNPWTNSRPLQKTQRTGAITVT